MTTEIGLHVLPIVTVLTLYRGRVNSTVITGLPVANPVLNHSSCPL